MDIWKSASGMLEVELTSAEPETALSAINSAGIEMSELMQVGELSCRFWIRRKDYPMLESLSKKRGERLCILSRKGLFWSLYRLRGRPVLLIGILLFLTVILYFPSRIFFVRVEGNTSVSSRKILAAAEECGIAFGASRREVRSEKMKNALLSAIPQLQWAGVNTSGCVATISVREKAEAEEAVPQRYVSSIVAARDGYILSGTVTQGNGVFQVGQTVKSGQVLISGYTDCGICIRAVRSQGEIFAQTVREMRAITPQEYARIGDGKQIKRKISLLIRKKRINLWKDSGISDTSCGRMYEEYYVTLPGGFQLPVALCVERFLQYDIQTAGLSETEAFDHLRVFSKRYLTGQMVAGKILDGSEMLRTENGAYQLIGSYICTEMIGREQQEQIGDTNGESD